MLIELGVLLMVVVGDQDVLGAYEEKRRSFIESKGLAVL